MKNAFKLYRYRKLLFFSLSICTIFSCSHQKKQKTSAKKIGVTFYDQESLIFSDYFHSPEFLVLETTDNNLIRRITDVKLINSKYYAFSQAPDNMVNIYNLDGVFLNQINNRGRGPGQINFATSFDVNSHITLLDRGNRKLINYSLKGEYISETRLNYYYNSFSYLNNNLIALHDFHSPQKINNINDTERNDIPISKLTFWEYDGNAKMELTYNTKDLNKGKHIPIRLKNYFTTNKGTLYYWDTFNDSLMGVDLNSQKNKLYYLLDFGEFQIPKKIFEKGFEKGSQGWENAFKKGYATIVDFVPFPSGHQIFIFSRYANKSVGIRKNNETEVKCFSKICFDNIHSKLEISMNRSKFSLISYENPSEVYFGWDAAVFIEIFEDLRKHLTTAEWNSMIESNPSLKDALRKIDKNDNPIILKTKLL